MGKKEKRKWKKINIFASICEQLSQCLFMLPFILDASLGDCWNTSASYHNDQGNKCISMPSALSGTASLVDY